MAAHSKKKQSQAEHSQGPRHRDGRDPLSLWWVPGFTLEAGPDKGEDQVVKGADQPTKDAVNQKKIAKLTLLVQFSHYKSAQLSPSRQYCGKESDKPISLALLA